MNDNDNMIPQLNVSLPSNQENADQDVSRIIPDEQLVGIYGEILDEVRTDKKEIDDVLTNFMDMVMNDGDSTTSSKEAVVNLLKLKSDQSDKMTKIADLMTRIKLKEQNTFPRYLAAHQNNTINISDDHKKTLLKEIEKAQKGKK